MATIVGSIGKDGEVQEAVLFDAESREFRRASGPVLSPTDLAEMDLAGEVHWKDASYSVAVSRRAAADAAREQRDKEPPIREPLRRLLGGPGPRIAAVILSIAAVLLLGWGGMVAFTGSPAASGGPTPESVSSDFRAAEAAAEDGDVASYEMVVDTDAFGQQMLAACLQAYQSLPAQESSAAAVAAIRDAYADYPESVRRSIREGRLNEVPLYGLASGEFSVDGGRVSVLVVPVPGEPAVTYTFERSEGGRYALVSADGLAEHLRPVVVALIEAARRK